MRIPGQYERLRIYTGEDVLHDGRPVFELLIKEAQRLGLAGATVLRGLTGYGLNSQMRSARILVLSEDMPVVIEIVDEPEKIKSFLPIVEKMLSEGLVTREPVEVLLRRGQRSGSSA